MTTGVNLAWFRVYDPELGRWLSRDPLEEKAGLNIYQYCFNDPLGLIDPDGLAPGQPYPSAAAAAAAALRDSLKASNNNNKYSPWHPEYNSTIYSKIDPKTGEKSYSYTCPNEATKFNGPGDQETPILPAPPDTDFEGWTHLHPFGAMGKPPDMDYWIAGQNRYGGKPMWFGYVNSAGQTSGYQYNPRGPGKTYQQNTSNFNF